MTVRADRVPGQNLRRTDGVTWGTTVDSPNNTCGIQVVGAMTIMKHKASVPIGLDPRNLDASCSKLDFRIAFEHKATSPNTMEKPTAASGWRITTPHVEREERTMICSSSLLPIYLVESARACLDHL
jgi:hypothetical protein